MDAASQGRSCEEEQAELLGHRPSWPTRGKSKSRPGTWLLGFVPLDRIDSGGDFLADVRPFCYPGQFFLAASVSRRGDAFLGRGGEVFLGGGDLLFSRLRGFYVLLGSLAVLLCCFRICKDPLGLWDLKFRNLLTVPRVVEDLGGLSDLAGLATWSGFLTSALATPSASVAFSTAFSIFASVRAATASRRRRLSRRPCDLGSLSQPNEANKAATLHATR